jgi:hypothetical protein
MNFPKRWNSVRYACFARPSLVTLSPASLLLRMRSSRHHKTRRTDLNIINCCRAKTENRSSWDAALWGSLIKRSKAFDVDLRCPVTLKVISEKYLGDESARLRFLREARTAASVRHANVASVFHLGRTGQNYFYAMEFVEGETLENLIKRSGRLEEMFLVERRISLSWTLPGQIHR